MKEKSFFVIISAIFILFVFNYLPFIFLNEEIENLEEEVSKLEEEVSKLEEEVSKLKEQKKEIISKVIWCENRKSEKSLRLVASVIYNRSKEKTLDFFYEEVMKPYQFSCVNNNFRDLSYQIKNKKDLEMLNKAKNIVDEMEKGIFVPLTSATHYLNTKKVKKIPKWVKKYKHLQSFEDHVYLLHD